MYVLVAGAMVLSLVSMNAKAGGADARISIGAELGLPMGTFGDGSSLGIGGSLRYEMPMGDNLALMGTVGFLSFSGKDITSGVPGYSYTSKSSLTMIPIQVGAKYYFTEQQNGFYAMAQLGLTLANYKNENTIDIAGTKTTVSGSASSSGLSYAPGLGYHLASLDFGLSYQLFSQTVSSSYTNPFTGLTSTVSATSTGSYLGVRIAYVLGGK